MKTIVTWSVILFHLMNAAAFCTFIGVRGAGAMAPHDQYIDLTSPITAVNETVQAEAPLQPRVTLPVNPVPFDAQEASSDRLLSSGFNGQEKEHSPRDFTVPPFLVDDIFSLRTMPPGRSNGAPGMMLFCFLVFLIILARSNLPWALMRLAGYPLNPGLRNGRVFYLGESV